MVGGNIKRFRIQKNLTQSDLAEALGVAEGTVRRYESGNISPPLDRLEQIANVLEVNIVQLIDGSSTDPLTEFSKRYDNLKSFYEEEYCPLVIDQMKLLELVGKLRDRLDFANREIARQDRSIQDLNEFIDRGFKRGVVDFTHKAYTTALELSEIKERTEKELTGNE